MVTRWQHCTSGWHGSQGQILPSRNSAHMPVRKSRIFLLKASAQHRIIQTVYKLGTKQCEGFPGGSDGKESACIAGDLDSTPGSGRFPGERNGKPLQYSCLENSVDRGTRQLQSIELQRVAGGHLYPMPLHHSSMGSCSDFLFLSRTSAILD